MSTNKHHIAIIGPGDTISGFTALGVTAYEAYTSDEALDQLRLIKRQTDNPEIAESYAVVCIIEEVLLGVDEAEYAKVASGALPAVVVLPGPQGSQGIALTRLRALAEKAVGSAII